MRTSIERVIMDRKATNSTLVEIKTISVCVAQLAGLAAPIVKVEVLLQFKDQSLAYQVQ